MRVSLIGTTLGLALAALTVGCGSTARMAMMPTAAAVQSLAKATDPFAQIHKVAEQIWAEMETSDFESRTQMVSGQSAGAPKYAFLNIAADKQDPTTVLYRSGTYAMITQKPNVQISFVASVAARKHQDPALVAAATRAIKNYIKSDWKHPVTELILAPQATGSKYAFIAFSKNQPDEDGSGRLMDWTIPGHYATTTQKVEASAGFGHGHAATNTATNHYMEKNSK
ncbi:MAG: hypothetical protein H7338_20300 [Candidatus Sericytochromatia bacterium]|nr:hypothetical protein [Candidatus Sericytochromatia bacterium]